MPTNWIGNIKLTGETEILDNDGTKLHDLIPCNQGAGVLVDKELYPVLASKLPKVLVGEGALLTSSASWATGLATAGDTIWVIDRSNKLAIAYDLGGVPAPDRNISLSNVPLPYKAFCTESALWILDDSSGTSGTYYEYGFNGAYVGSHFISGGRAISGTWDGTHFWLYHQYINNGTLRQYDSNWVHTGVSHTFSFTAGESSAIANDFTSTEYILITDSGGANVFKVDKLTGTEIATAVNYSAFDMASSVDKLYMLGGSNTPVKQWGASANVPNMAAPAGSPHPYKIIADKT